jgi:hypothetical protein
MRICGKLQRLFVSYFYLKWSSSIKGEARPITDHEGLGGEYSTLSLTSALDAGGPQSQSGQVRKLSPPPRFDSRTIQLSRPGRVVFNWKIKPLKFKRHATKINKCSELDPNLIN